MATPCEEEAMEVEQNPGESTQTSDLNIVINGENDEYIIRNMFGTIFFKKNREIPIFLPILFLSVYCKKSRCLAIVIIIVIVI